MHARPRTEWCRSGASWSPTPSPRSAPSSRSSVPTTAGFLLESVEGGERWGRYSFVGRNPLATVSARGTEVSVEGTVDLDALTGGRVTGDGGMLAALEAILGALRRTRSSGAAAAPRRHGRLPRLRRGARGRAPAAPAPRRPRPSGCVDGGHRAARGLRPLATASRADRQRGDPARVGRPGARRGLPPRRGPARPADRGLLPAHRRAVPSTSSARGSPGRRGADHAGLAVRGRGACGQGAHHRGRRLPGRALPALRPRRRSGADPFDVYRVLRLVNPSPYLYFLRFPEVTVVGASPEPMVRLRDGDGHLAPDRRIAPTREDRRRRPAPRGRARRGSEGGRRARDARRPRPQRRRPRGPLRHRGGRGAHGGRALQPHHAPHLARSPVASPTGRGRSTCCGRPCRRERSRARQRCGRWRSSTISR